MTTAIEHAAKVLEKIKTAIQNDSGAKADLKRALTGEPRHQRAAYPIVLRFLSQEEVEYNLDQWLWVTGFLAYYDQNLNVDHKTNFGDSARRLKGDNSDNSSGGPDRRFRALLETSMEDLRSPLTSMVRLMKSKKVNINYPQLIVDLKYWSHPDQFIQDQWARSFWPPRFNSSQEEESV